MLALALSFFRSPLGKYVALAFAILAIALSLMHLGAQGVRREVAKRDQAAKADLAKHEATASAISQQASSNLAQRQAQIITRYRTLIQKVPQYVTASDDAACRVPDSFVELWNLGPGDAGKVPG